MVISIKFKGGGGHGYFSGTIIFSLQNVAEYRFTEGKINYQLNQVKQHKDTNAGMDIVCQASESPSDMQRRPGVVGCCGQGQRLTTQIYQCFSDLYEESHGE